MVSTKVYDKLNDTYADQRYASSHLLGQAYNLVNGSGTTGAKAYILAPNLPRGLKVLDAHYVLKAADPWTSTTLTPTRVSTAPSGGYSKISWNLQPSTVAVAGQATTSPGTLSPGDSFNLDITKIAQDWADGRPNYGIRITSSSTTGNTPAGQRKFHSYNASPASRRPKLSVTGYLTSSKPTGLNPPNDTTVGTGTPQFKWAAQTGAFSNQAGYRVAIYSDAAGTTLVEDSGWVVSTANTYTPTATLANGSSWWWKVKTRSYAAVDAESPYTSLTKITRADKPTVTISAPGTTVNDAMVTTSWSISAGVQLAWRVEHYDPDDPTTIIADSDWVNNTATSWTTDVSTQVQRGSKTVRVSVVTSVSPSVPQPGVPVESVNTQAYSYAAGATADPTSLVLATTSPQPGLHGTFTCASAPDEIVIWRDDTGTGNAYVEIQRGPSTDFLISGTSYEFYDYTARPRITPKWAVVAVTGGIDSDPVAATATITPKYIWLLDPQDSSWWLALADQDDAGLAFTEDSEVAYIRGSDRAQLVTDTLHGYEGQISGSVYESLPDLGSLGAQSLRDRVWHLKQNSTRTYRLILSDQNIPVVVKDVQVSLRPQSDLQYGITFNAYQQGEVSWQL